MRSPFVHSFIDWTAYWAVRLTAFGVRRIPLRIALALGNGIGLLGYFLSSRRGVAYANLKAAFPLSTAPQRKQWTREHYRHLGMCGAEMMRFPVLTAEESRHLVKSPENEYENYLRLLGEKRGLILLTAHLGNWELSQIVEAVRGRPLAVLARKQKYRRLDGLLHSFRQQFGSIAIGKERGEIRGLIRYLRQGGCVGMLADQSGGDEGIWVRFFGRLTTAPRGPMALALKFNVPVLPAAMVRREGPNHVLSFDPSFQLVRTGDFEKDILINTQNYLHLLEALITRFPSQWLWGHKRWKRTRTKRLLLLSDGKPGHVKQSEALIQEVLEKGRHKKPPYEILVEKIEVRFRGALAKRLFPFFAFLGMPWAQGRLRWLGLFLVPECAGKLERSNPDWIVSTGASLAPLNLLLRRENLAKSIVLMKPSFPFNFFQYELALIPKHDRGRMPLDHFRIQGAFSRMEPEAFETSRELLARSLRDPSRVRLGLFLGGETRGFKPSVADVLSLVGEIERSCEKWGGDFLVTTSRRTPEEVSQFLRERLRVHPRCQLCVIASEDKRPEVVPGMMALAETLIVTEDSLSMISEALSALKRVVVVKMSRNGLPRKHFRFQEFLKKEWGVPVVEIERLADALGNGEAPRFPDFLERERTQVREKLECLF